MCFCNWTTLKHRALTRTFNSIYAKCFKYIGRWLAFDFRILQTEKLVDDVGRASGPVLSVLWLLTCAIANSANTLDIVFFFCCLIRIAPQLLLAVANRFIADHKAINDATYNALIYFFILFLTAHYTKFHANSIRISFTHFYGKSIILYRCFQYLLIEIYTRKPNRIVFFLVIVLFLHRLHRNRVSRLWAADKWFPRSQTHRTGIDK